MIVVICIINGEKFIIYDFDFKDIREVLELDVEVV